MRDDPNRKLNDRYDRLRLIRTLVLLASHAHDSHEDATEALADRYARRSRLEPAFAIRDCHDALMRLMGALHVADALLRDRVAIDD